MIQSNYNFKEVNGRLSLASETLKNQSDLASFKCYNRLIGFFLKLFGKAQNFQANDMSGSLKVWVVNKNSFNRWQKSLPEGKNLDAKIKAWVDAVREEQDRLKAHKIRADTQPQQQEEIVIKDNLKNSIELFLPIAPKTQETSAVADDSAKRQETSRESATSQANEEESLSQEPLDQKSKEEESITHLKTDEKVKDKHTTLNEIALAFARADHETQIDETSYLNLIKYQILGGWEFNDNPLYCIDEVKFEGTPSALKAYELFTSPEELEKMYANKIITNEAKEKLLRRVILEEQVQRFAETRQKDGLNEEAFYHFVIREFLEKIFFGVLPSIDLEKIKGESVTGQLAFEFLTDSDELEKLVQAHIIPSSVKENLLKLKPQPIANQGTEAIEETKKEPDFELVREQVLAFATNKRKTRLNEEFLNEIISTLKDQRFIDDPLYYLKEVKEYDDSLFASSEHLAIYRFFTDPDELEKLGKAGFISATIKDKLLNPVKNQALAFASNKRGKIFDENFYLKTIQKLLENPDFKEKPFDFLNNLSGVSHEEKIIYAFFTDLNELNRLFQMGIINYDLKFKLLNPPKENVQASSFETKEE